MITSTGNARIRELVKLKKNAKERRSRDAFIVEGIKMFREIPRELLLKVYASQSFVRGPSGGALEGIAYEEVSDPVFEYLSDTKTPQGILAVVRCLHYTKEQLVSGKGPALWMVLENIQDPGNLGTILRTSEGAGVTAIVLTRGCSELYSPKVTRSTMGSIFRMPFLYVDNTEEAAALAKEAGITLYAAHLEGTAAYYEEDYTKAAAFLIGNESRGLSETAAKLADVKIRIPMAGKVESLNAAVASSVLMYEAARQRMCGR